MSLFRREERFRKLVAAINGCVSLYGLTYEDVKPLLRGEAVQEAAKTVIKNQGIHWNYGAFRELAAQLSDALGVELPLHVLDRPLALILRWLRTTLSALLFLFVFYMVIGGVLEGKAILSSDPLICLGMLGVLVLTLGAFEGLQMSVGFLRLKDPSTLETLYQRAAAYHKKFRSETATKRFLAGRQLVVIVVVFFLSRLTSFSDFHKWPFTDVPFPGWMQGVRFH